MTTANLTELKEILKKFESTTEKKIIIDQLDLLMVKTREIRYKMANIIDKGGGECVTVVVGKNLLK